MYKKNYCLVLVIMLTQFSCWAMEQNVFIDFIRGFDIPVNIAITPNNLYAYVTNDGSNSVVVIDVNSSSTTFNTLIPAPNLSGVFNSPDGIAITPDSKFAYVCDSGSNSVLVIDTNPANSTFNSLIAAPQLNGFFNVPGSIGITPDGLRAYVTNGGTNSVSVIDINPASPTYNTILVTPGLNGILDDPFVIAITPSGLYAYVCNLTGSVTAIDVNPASPTYNTALVTPGLNAVNPQPEGLAITANSLFAYVADGSSANLNVLDINPSSSTFNTVLSAPNLISVFNAPNGIVTTADGNYAYVTNFLGSNGSVSSVSVVNTSASSPQYNSTINTPGLSLPFLTRFVALAITPDARFVYAVDGDINTVDVIYTGIIDSPLNFMGVQIQNRFLLEINWVNRLTWSAPTLGNPPVAYKIYRDAALTQLIATVPATAPLQYVDLNRLPNVKYTYYIVSVDGFGNSSVPTSTTVS